MKIALLCGGPSLERGISLNSARSVLDHLGSEQIEIVPVYFDFQKQAYKISQAQLYSNTPSDFDYKLKQTTEPLSSTALIKLLKSMDLMFPVMHGPFGEDGEIQSFLEKHEIPFVGSSARTCKLIFDKHRANNFLKERGFFTLPSALLKIYHDDHRQIIEEFFTKNKIKRAIVKPASGGSSIGVFSVGTVDEALHKAELIFSKRMDTRVVIEPFAEGVEFTVIVLRNRFGLPVAILPTEIETDYTEHQIFDFRKKYLPTRHVTYHCPPRFSNEMIEKIQVQAEQIFAATGMRDFARFDGWVFPDGRIWFSDLNPISGMEQNSFLFQQASRVGLSHADLLQFVVERASERCGIKMPQFKAVQDQDRKVVSVLFGGNTSERQVSLMSGTNVWLKLRRSSRYKPIPYLLDTTGTIWKLPYQLALNHTVEEITENCQNYALSKERLSYLEEKVRLRLGLSLQRSKEFFDPMPLNFKDFLVQSSFVFNALHGGDGENGNIQTLLARNQVLFNGPNAKISRLCADKWATCEAIKNLKIDGVNVANNQLVATKTFLVLNQLELSKLWRELRHDLGAATLIVKPRADGCSTGVVRLSSIAEFTKYQDLLKRGSSHIPAETFKNQHEVIELPQTAPDDLLVEQFIETDSVRVERNQLNYRRKSGWIEVTVGLLEEGGEIRVFNPSLTVAEGEVLSVEEKFQGGTGINMTPPPEKIVSKRALARSKELIKKVARQLCITGYSRIDAFLEVKTGNLIIIEVNTLPGLTPSTVLYQQALAEKPAIFPRELLERIIAVAGY